MTMLSTILQTQRGFERRVLDLWRNRRMDTAAIAFALYVDEARVERALHRCLDREAVNPAGDPAGRVPASGPQVSGPASATR